MKKPLVIALLCLFGVSALKAQDTVDTSYYRYLRLPIANYCNYYETAEENTIIDSLNVCPNGWGFMYVGRWFGRNIPMNYRDYFARMTYITRKAGRVYGMAVMIDSVGFDNEYDTISVRLAKMSDDSTQWIFLDSIAITKNSVGVVRYMSIPLISEWWNLNPDGGGPTPRWNGQIEAEPFENCIVDVKYVKVVELYFDEPIDMADQNELFVNIRCTDEAASKIIIPVPDGERAFNQYFKDDPYCLELYQYQYDTYGNAGVSATSWTHFFYNCKFYPVLSKPIWNCVFPILTPLPGWESDKMDSVFVHWENYMPDPTDTTDVSDTSDVSGIRGVEMELGMRVYPNPASEEVTVRSDGEMERYEVYDIMGRMVSRGRVEGREAKVDVRGLRSGMYELRVKGPRGMAVRRVSVRR